MIKKQILYITLLFTIVALAATGAMAQGKQKNSPFLITGKMPHLTKVLVQNWDNAELNLTEEQKVKLLVVRKETIGSAQRLGKEIAGLEQQVADGSLAGKKPEELGSLVEQVAKLKTEATMTHLRCIFNTSNILDQQQLDVLTK